MSQLDEAEADLRAAREHAQGLASMGSLELENAVAVGPSGARDLQKYHDRLRTANQRMALIYTQVQQLRREAGLALLPAWPQVTPDWPTPDPFKLNPKTAAYLHLMGALNARDQEGVARYLGELDGSLPDGSDHGDESPPASATGATPT